MHIMCESVASTMFMHVTDCFKTQKTCGRALEKYSKMSKIVLDYFKTQEISEKIC